MAISEFETLIRLESAKTPIPETLKQGASFLIGGFIFITVYISWMGRKPEFIHIVSRG